MAMLQVLEGLPPGQVFTLDKKLAILGRHPDCDIVLDSGAVSRQHARILEIDGKFHIEDLHSRNGTYVNGQPVRERQLLQEHDRITLCHIAFEFLNGPQDPATPTKKPATGLVETASLVDDEGQVQSNSTVMSRVDVSTGSSGLRLEVNPQAKLKALIEISRSLGRALSLNEVLPKLLDGLFAIFAQADRGSIVLRDPITGRLMPKAVKHRRQELAEMVRISRTIVNGVMASKEAILSADAASDARFNAAESILDFHIRSMMCAPLVNAEGQALGVIQIDTLDQRNRFNRDDLDVLASVACQAAFAVDNAQLHEAAMREQALSRELSVAHDVLRGFLPASRPKIDGYEFFDFYEPAHELGGDYYDYIPLPGDRLGVVVADVSGKGIPASLLMAKLSADVRYCLASEARPADAVGRLNRVLCDSGWDDRFVTLILAVLDPARHEVTVVNAGHMPPLVRHGREVTEAIGEEVTRLPLGVERDVEYIQSTRPVAPGDCLALCTDGITEAMNEQDDLYGFERLKVQLASEATGIVLQGRRILSDVKRFVGSRPQSDDMCLVCFGRTGEKQPADDRASAPSPPGKG